MRQHTLMRGTFTQDIDMSWIFVIGKSGLQQVSAKMHLGADTSYDVVPRPFMKGVSLQGAEASLVQQGEGGEQDGEEEKTVGGEMQGCGATEEEGGEMGEGRHGSFEQVRLCPL